MDSVFLCRPYRLVVRHAVSVSIRECVLLELATKADMSPTEPTDVLVLVHGSEFVWHSRRSRCESRNYCLYYLLSIRQKSDISEKSCALHTTVLY